MTWWLCWGSCSEPISDIYPLVKKPGSRNFPLATGNASWVYQYQLYTRYFSSSFVGHKVVEGCGRLPFDPMLLGGCYLATMLFLNNQTSGISFQRESQDSTTTQKWSKITERESLPPSFQGSWVLGKPATPLPVCRSAWLQLRSCPGALRANGNVGTSRSEGQSFQGAKFSSP